MTRPPRLRDQAVALPIATLVLLLPPLLQVFGQADGLGGVPPLFVYLFGVWAVAILLGWRLARRLNRAYDAASTAERADGRDD